MKPLAISNESDIIDKAAHWAALIDGGDMSDIDRESCESWCAADPQHRLTLDRMLCFDARLAEAGAPARDALHELLEQRPSPFRGVGGPLLGIAVIGLAGWAALISDGVRDYFPDHETRKGEISPIALSDGSRLTLDTQGAVRVSFDSAQRKIRLIRGRVLADVTRNAARPFTVETVHGTATALGTSFTVTREADDTLVTVIKSHVRVCPSRPVSEPEVCVVLGPGEQARIDGQSVLHEASAAPDTAGLWATGWLEADDMDVADILTQLNRYAATPLHFDPSNLHGITATGSFPLRNTSQALDGLARSAAINVRHGTDGMITVYRRR